MGRHAEGPKVRWKRGWAYVNFTWQGREFKESLGTQDPGEASERAARAYADVVRGRRRPSVVRPGRLADLSTLWDDFVEWKRPSVDIETTKMLVYYGNRFVSSFKSLDRITKATIATYSLARLGQVTRTTLLKERCFLRQFLAWCEDERILEAAPVVPPLPPRAKGTRSGPQRAKPVEVTAAEVVRIIARLPAESKTIDGRKWPVRDRFAFAWEMTFRPETVSRLSVPENWRPGMKHVELADDDDKARFGRSVDLTPVALRILRRWVVKAGPIFGGHNFTKALKRAAKAVLGPARGKQFAPYDIRHTRAKALLDAGVPLRAVSFGLGHKRPSTTDKYTAPDRKAWKDAIRTAG